MSKELMMSEQTGQSFADLPRSRQGKSRRETIDLSSVAAMNESIFRGVELVNATGDRIQGEDAVHDKVIALYFSAEWCPYCQELQPALNKFYEDVNAKKSQLEIIFVSSDNSKEDHLAYFKKKHGPWWTIPFDNELRNDLKRKYLVAARKEQEQVGVPDRLGGLPTLLIIKANGDLIARDGVERVKEDGVKAFEKWLLT